MNAIPSAVTQIFGSEGGFKQYIHVMMHTTHKHSLFLASVFVKWVALLMGDISLTPMLRAASFSFYRHFSVFIIEKYECASYFPGNRAICTCCYHHFGNCFIYDTAMVTYAAGTIGLSVQHLDF